MFYLVKVFVVKILLNEKKRKSKNKRKKKKNEKSFFGK